MVKDYWVKTYAATDSSKALSTASLVGKAGIAPLSITVSAPQALANLRASLNRPSSCKYRIYHHLDKDMDIEDFITN